MKYKQDILEILYEAGKDGLSVRKLALNVYNLHNGLFENVSYSDVYKEIFAYLNKNSKSPRRLVEKTGKRGHYRLSEKIENSSQLLFEFSDDRNEDTETKSNQDIEDKSLSLFCMN